MKSKQLTIKEDGKNLKIAYILYLNDQIILINRKEDKVKRKP